MLLAQVCQAKSAGRSGDHVAIRKTRKQSIIAFWKVVDCQKEVHKCTTNWKFGEEEANIANDKQQSEVPQREPHQTEDEDGKRRRFETFPSVVASRPPVTSSHAWRRVSIAIDSGACDSVTSAEHVLELLSR